MVRFGLTLLIPSSLLVAGRLAEISYFGAPIVRVFCLLSLSIAFGCFIGRYFQVQILAHARTPRRLERRRLTVAHSLSHL